MKVLLVLGLLAISAATQASEGKCLKAANTAAFNYVKNDENISIIEDFNFYFANEFSKVVPQNGYNFELWSFTDGYTTVNVEVKEVNGQCNVKKVSLSQNEY